MKNMCNDYKSPDMQILLHHIYEYKKGLRNLVLHTMNRKDKYKVEELLKKKDITFKIVDVNELKINVFFGNHQCVHIINLFGEKSLTEFSDEEDFILGVMLGYDRIQQCNRYIKRKKLVDFFIKSEKYVHQN